MTQPGRTHEAAGGEGQGRDEPPTTWKKMLGGYFTSREAIDQARRFGQDGHRKHLEFQVNLDRENGRYYIEYRRKAS
jgi:hypothetical protein